MITHRVGTQDGHPYIECLICGMKSFNKNDIRYLWCAKCGGTHPIPEHS